MVEIMHQNVHQPTIEKALHPKAARGLGTLSQKDYRKLVEMKSPTIQHHQDMKEIKSGNLYHTPDLVLTCLLDKILHLQET